MLVYGQTDSLSSKVCVFFEHEFQGIIMGKARKDRPDTSEKEKHVREISDSLSPSPSAAETNNFVRGGNRDDRFGILPHLFAIDKPADSCNGIQ